MLGIKRSGTRGKLLLEKRERFPLKTIHEVPFRDGSRLKFFR
ncbi:hypothetical protein PC116_g22141 [Phytophthora cactorum]|uniref:Uncharacterized protein n=1 Tax=Phytophthora cactorum TaxID=29920 RepID=A0A8T1JYF3_9STRA|nr:hypothetical protein Pcac1_g25715 [Phytophthora cactorum]KAG2885384.1 hypothetical protein PC114_g19692 [Phytophthora cactorum]KAG2914103.1 hypothetical protein PC117_g18438 [Phytophthora cactorum]KAG2989977.1 hypothetical protein PC119_g19199 [Phytophthora cactorum]KAG3149995.1 hypothetical protein C6341_g16891 [Phytophthora cactorum]